MPDESVDFAFYALLRHRRYEATHKHGVAIVVKNALKRYFIYQRDDKPEKVNQDEGVPVHQLDRLAGQVPHMGTSYKNRERAGRGLHQNKHRAPGRALNHERTAGTQTHQFASNDIARYHALGVAESICNGCHSSFALFKKFFQWVGFCRAFCTNL
jgi:hypothetical protein